MAVGQVLRVGVQALYFILLARVLGSRDFGAYASVLAVVAVAAPFSSMGSGNLLIKHVARAPHVFSMQWGRAVATTLLSGTVLLSLVTMVSRVWLPSSIPLGLVVAVGAADLVFARLVDVSAQAFQAYQEMPRVALLQLLLSPLRLLAIVGLMLATTAPSATEWGLLYLVTAIAAAGVAVRLVNHDLGKPVLRSGHLASELREGALFATTLSAQSSTNDIDKAILARLATLETTGIYAAAYRLVDAVFLPVGSLLIATYARFFQHGVHGVRATSRYARQLLSVAACYGVVAALALYLLAPVVPVILGEEYRNTVTTVRWLAILPLLKTIHYFGADALTGSGHQGLRTTVLVTIAGLNVLLNLWLIPEYSWRGAAAATIVSDGLMAIAIWTTLWYLGRRGGPIRPAEQAASAVEVA